jgi:hypothetical protein
MPESVPTSQMLGVKQLSAYLKERGVDPATIPTAAMRELVELANEQIDLAALRNSQAIVMYMGALKSQSEVIADYCKKSAPERTCSDQAVCAILIKHRVASA